MKKITKILASVLAIAGLASCEPKDKNPTGGETADGLVFGQIGSAGLGVALGCIMDANYDYVFEAKDTDEGVFFVKGDESGEVQAETIAYTDFAEGSVLVLGTGFSGKGAGVLADYKAALNDLVAHESHFEAIIVCVFDASCRGTNSDQLLDLILPVADVVLYAEAQNQDGHLKSDSTYQLVEVNATDKTAANFAGKKIVEIGNSFLTK